MFKLNFDPKKVEEKHIINPEDLLPKEVETTDGKISPFDAKKIIKSLMVETKLEEEKAVQVTINVLRKLGGLGLEFIAAPHLRELVCGELTAQGLHEYRNRYTRLGIPIYDVKKLLTEQRGQNFASFLAAQVIEQYVHLDRLSEAAEIVIEQISHYTKNLPEEERTLIESAMENALKLYNEKKKKHLV
ncbi:MAG: hypothetical protein DRO88_11445 [Promethearchaeia archaeon]|nr:MAG: hypothetical protein DRO88_11445 [Candidatus Lokiarchaeia archaeon]